jgi:hypothetical protein
MSLLIYRTAKVIDAAHKTANELQTTKTRATLFFKNKSMMAVNNGKRIRNAGNVISFEEKPESCE